MSKNKKKNENISIVVFISLIIIITIIFLIKSLFKGLEKWIGAHNFNGYIIK